MNDFTNRRTFLGLLASSLAWATLPTFAQNNNPPGQRKQGARGGDGRNRRGPQPSFAGDDHIRDLQNYGYRQGVFLGNSGHLRVTVSKRNVVVEYVKAPPDRQIADRHVITAE